MSSTQVTSTIQGLSGIGYVSSSQLFSTVRGFTQGFVTSTLSVQSGAYMASTYTQFISTNSLIGDSIVSLRTYAARDNNIAYSANGTTWANPVVNGFLNSGNGIAFGLGIWVAAGSASYAKGTLKYSTDRINWIDARNGGFDNDEGVFEGYSVAFNGTIFMAGGRSGFPSATTQRSTDGSNWTASANGFANPVYGITWAPSLGPSGISVWVAVGNGNGIPNRSIQSSSDGSNWSAIGASGALSIGYDVAASATAIVAVGTPSGNPAGCIVRSSGGASIATWTSIGNPALATGKGVSYNASAPAAAQWIVLGQTNFGAANTIFNAGGSSPASFSAATSGGFIGIVGNDAAWADNKWHAVGAGSINGGTVLNSTDGTNWVSLPAIPFEYYGAYVGNAIAHNGTNFVALGDGETQTDSVKVSVMGPSSISTRHIDVDTLTADSILVSGSNTLTVSGNSFLNGRTAVGGLLTTVGVSTIGAVNITGPVNINSNILTVPTVTARALTASTITLFDQSSNANLGNIYYNRSLLYLNSNLILTDNTASGSLTLSTLFVTNTISTTNLFASNISTSMINARFMSVRNIYVSTIGLGDIQYPWVVNRLYASSQMLYFNDINLTSTFVGNGCGTCINSNIYFTSVRADTISSSSTFVNFLSTGMQYAGSISSLTFDTPIITLRDAAAGESLSLQSVNGSLLYNGESLGVIPNIVNSNPIFNSVTTAAGGSGVGQITAVGTITAPTVVTLQTQVSTLVLQDQQFTTPSSNCPLYVRSGLLYFNDSNIIQLGPNMLFSTLGVMSNLMAGSISTSRISSAQIFASSIFSGSVSTNNLVINDTFGSTQPQLIYNSNGSLYYGRQPIALGGLSNSAPFFSTLSVRQFISTASNITDTLNVKLTATTCNMVGFAAAFQSISTLRVITSNLVFMDRFSGSNTLVTSNGGLFYNNQAIQYGGTNAPGVSQVSTMISFSTLTTALGTQSMSVSTILGPTSIGFRDVITGGTNSITTRNGVLYIGDNPATGTVVVASNFNLSNLSVLDTISTSSTFTSFLSTANCFVDTLTGINVNASNLNTATLNNGNSAFSNITVSNVNSRPYPIFNYGSNTTECCGSFAGYQNVGFTTPYTTTPTVTVTLSDTDNVLAIMNITYIDQYGFTVGSFDINTGTATAVPSISFNWIAIGI